MQFTGADYDHDRDSARLTAQYERIWNLMKDSKWRTLPEIENETGDPQASISAQLRHMRKQRFGGHTVIKEYICDGLYKYQLTPNFLTPSIAI